MRSATQALTVLAEIAPERRAELEARLAEMHAAREHSQYFWPGSLPSTHFTRFVIVHDDHLGEFPPLIAWECNHDGWSRDYLAEVARTAPHIERIFECCAHYPAHGVGDVDGWVDWMMRRSYPAGAFYTAYRGVRRAQIVNDRRVHDAIRDLLDHEDRAELAQLSRHEVQRRICARVAERHPQLDLSIDDEEETRWLVGKLLALLGALVLLPFALVLALPWYILLRHRESRDIASAYTQPVEIAPGVVEIEDQGIQNQLTHLVEIKRGEFRLATLWVVLKLIDVVARVYSVRGDLGGITAIHFARWVILRDRRPAHERAGRPRRHRLLFFSNYDGSWESYLGEFIDRAAYGLTAVWSNTRGFPATRYLVGDGARDEEAFKQWTREHQIPTQVWWTGAPDSTVRNVRDDIWIRRRLDRGLTDDEVGSWIRRL